MPAVRKREDVEEKAQEKAAMREDEKRKAEQDTCGRWCRERSETTDNIVKSLE